MQPEFEQYIEGAGALLLCPSCGGNYLHHEKVEIFERIEDADDGIHISVSDGTATVDKNLIDNPSSRRHGLIIHFTCEHCPATPIMTIIQHKGNTWIDFK